MANATKESFRLPGAYVIGAFDTEERLPREMMSTEHRRKGARSLLSEEQGVEQGGEWTCWRGRWEASGGGVWRGGGWCELRLVRSVRTYSGCRVQ